MAFQLSRQGEKCEVAIFSLRVLLLRVLLMEIGVGGTQDEKKEEGTQKVSGQKKMKKEEREREKKKITNNK